MNVRYCNICGSKMDFWDIQEDNTIHNKLGYGSKYDGEEIEIHFCCECVDKLIDRCAISPLMSQSSNYRLVADESPERGFID